MGAPIASPKYAYGQLVRYVDNHGRHQTGEVLRTEASWSGNRAPLIVYSVRHPSYRNKRHYAAEADIMFAIAPASISGGRG